MVGIIFARMRRSFVRLALLGAALAGLLATCRYDSAGPRHGGPAYLAVQPIVGTGVDLAAFGLTADTIRLVVTRSPADTLRALTFFFDPDSSQIRLAADVTLRALVETSRSTWSSGAVASPCSRAREPWSCGPDDRARRSRSR